MRSRLAALSIAIALVAPARAKAQAASPAWDSVAAILQTSAVNSGGYRRFNLPRRDLTLRIGDVTVAPALALGAWLGFSGEASDATMMGDLVAWCEEQGCAGMDAMALPGHRSAKNFFEESGFTARKLVMHHRLSDS